MKRLITVFCLLLIVTKSAPAQNTVPAAGKTTTTTPSPTFFGAPDNQPFNEKIFTPPPAPPEPPAQAMVPSVLPPGMSATDGGLLPPKKIWRGSADLGLNGTSGNSENFNFRTNWNAQRKTDDNIFVTDLLYNYVEQKRAVTTNQALYNARDEILFAGSPWSVFGAGQLEYDELRAFRFRVGLYTGLVYTVVDEKTMTLKFRGGAGAVRNIGTDGTQSQWAPELVLGYDYRFKWTDRSSFISILDFYPRLDDFARFRVRARAAYEYVIDPELGMIVRLGIQDRYDSDPGNAKRNDVTYFATLGVKF